MDMNLQQVAQRLHLSDEKVRLMIQEGRFPHAFKMDPAKVTSPFFIPERDVIAFEKKRRARPFVGVRTTRS